MPLRTTCSVSFSGCSQNGTPHATSGSPPQMSFTSTSRRPSCSARMRSTSRSTSSGREWSTCTGIPRPPASSTSSAVSSIVSARFITERELARAAPRDVHRRPGRSELDRDPAARPTRAARNQRDASGEWSCAQPSALRTLAGARSISSRCTLRVLPVRRFHDPSGARSHAKVSSARQRSSVSSSSARNVSSSHGREQLDARVEVTRHQVRRTHVVLPLLTALERVDARVLEEASHHGYHADVLADAGDAGAQAADPTHVDVHLNAGLGGLVEGADAALVHQRVHLQQDPGRLAGAVCLDGLLDLRQQPVAHALGSHQRLAVAGRACRAGERVEERSDVCGDVPVAREQAEVLVEPRRLGVVVAGSHVHVVPHARALAANHSSALACVLRPGDAMNDVGARLLQRAGPEDVAALVEARLELHEADRLLSALGGLDQHAAPGPSRRTCGTR